MRMEHLKRVTYIEQMIQTECGLCCVAMILQYYKSYEGIRRIRESLDVGRDGLKISILSRYLKKRGMDTKIYKASPDLLFDLVFPAIIFWNNEHFVVLEKINSKNATIVDPAFGRRKLRYEDFVKEYSNVIMIITPTDKFEPYNEKRSLWRDTFKNLKLKKSLFLKIGCASAVTYILQLLLPILIEKLMDNWENITRSQILNEYLLGAVLIAIIYGISTFYRGQKVISMQMGIDQYLSKGVFGKMLNIPYKFFESRSNGDLLFRLNCLSVVRDMISEKLIQGIIQIGMVIFIICYMFSKSPILTIGAILFFLLNFIYIIRMRPKLMEVNQSAIVEDTKLQSIQIEAVYSIFGIKSSGIEDEILASWDQRYERSLKAYKSKSIVKSLNNAVSSVFQMAGPLFVLVVGIALYKKSVMSIGEVVAIYALSSNLFSAGISILGIWDDFTLVSSYLDRLADIIEADEEIKPQNPININVNGDVELKDISFSYSCNSNRVLDNINLDIKIGQKVAIVGTSNSGKSTLSKIILGIYNPTEGDVLFDNINLNRLDKTKLRKQIGVVPQEMLLFNKSIFENIRMNKKGITLDDVKRAARSACIDEEIESMPMKYHTLVSDMGMNLSGGQRQRIALARAVLNDPKLIILDEATSALDYANERNVSDYFNRSGCTRIIIAHRLSTIKDADKIVILDDGIIKENGTHHELMEINGIYASLYHSRSNEIPHEKLVVV